MAKKTVLFTQEGIERLPNNKPVVYKILIDFCKVQKLVAAGLSLRAVISIFIVPYAT